MHLYVGIFNVSSAKINLKLRLAISVNFKILADSRPSECFLWGIQLKILHFY